MISKIILFLKTCRNISIQHQRNGAICRFKKIENKRRSLSLVPGFHAFYISFFREMLTESLCVGLICKSDGVVIIIYKIKCHYFLYGIFWR